MLAVALVLQSACGGDATGPDTKRSGVTLQYNGVVTDTIEAQIVLSINIEVRDRDGDLVSGAIVGAGALPAGVYPGRFDEAAGYVCSASVSLCPRNIVAFRTLSDDKGRVEMHVRLGNIVGQMLIVAQADGLPNTDTLQFSVTPGNPARVKAFANDVLVNLGRSMTVSGEVADRFGNIRPERPAYSVGPGSAVSVDAITGVVRGLDVGTQRIYARSGAAADSAFIGVRPTGRIVGMTSDADDAIHLIDFDGTNDRIVVPRGQTPNGYLRGASRAQNRILMPAAVDASQGPATVGIRVLDSLGTTIRTIRPPAIFSEVLTARIIADGTMLMVARPFDPFPSPNYMAVYRANVDGVVTRIADLPTLVPFQYGADISPDGRRVAFISRASSQTNELRVLDLSNGTSNLLAPDAREPMFSPTGDRIAYIVATGIVAASPAIGLAVVRIDGTETRVVSAADYSGGISWSPDGAMLLARLATSHLHRVVRITDGAFVTLRFRENLIFEPNLFGVEWW